LLAPYYMLLLFSTGYDTPAICSLSLHDALPISTQVGRVMVDSVNVNVRAGEVVGIAGLMGAGRTEFAMSLFGRTYGREITGRVLMHGREVSTATVYDAIRAGIA